MEDAVGPLDPFPSSLTREEEDVLDQQLKDLVSNNILADVAKGVFQAKKFITTEKSGTNTPTTSPSATYDRIGRRDDLSDEHNLVDAKMEEGVRFFRRQTLRQSELVEWG